MTENEQHQDLHDVARAFGGFFTLLALVIVMVPLALLIWGYNRSFRQCVVLENGLNLGYEAVFDLSKPTLRPIAVPRFPDGTPLLRDPLWGLYVTDTTVYGVTYGVKDGDYRFAWRADTGLILKPENDALYRALVAEAGQANWDLGPGSFGTEILLNDLRQGPATPAHRCPTALITW